MTSDPQRAERFIARLRTRLMKQVAELCQSGEVPPSTIATLYLEAAVATALLAHTPPCEVAAELRRRADVVEEEGGGALASRN